MTIWKSKTYQRGRGKTFTLVINSVKAQLICPVRAIQIYLLMRITNLCDQLFIPTHKHCQHWTQNSGRRR
jgi:hypothetical protein